MSQLKGFSGWDQIGNSLLGDVWEGGRIKTFTMLQEKFSLHHTQFFRHLQLRHALLPYLEGSQNIPEHNPLEAKVLLTNLSSHKISCIYKTLVIHSLDTFPQLRAVWASNLTSLADEDWREALMSPREAAIASHF